MRDLILTFISTAVVIAVVTWVMTERTAADWRMGAILVASVCASRAVIIWRPSRRVF